LSTGGPPTDVLIGRLERAISQERFAGYVAHCAGDRSAAVELYRWNAQLSGAFWQTLGHVEVMLRNALDARMRYRQARHGGRGDWLVDPRSGLDDRAKDDIVRAQRRVLGKRKQPGHGQVVSELGFGFWRFLLARRYQGSLWPDLAAGFPLSPSRDRRLIEAPVVRLHEFRNRLAHQQRVWTEPTSERYADCLVLAGYIDADVRDWIAATSEVPAVLAARPRR
jgi:hypothetical protein